MLNILLNCLMVLGIVVVVALIAVVLLVGGMVVVAICEKIGEVMKSDKKR